MRTRRMESKRVFFLQTFMNFRNIVHLEKFIYFDMIE